MLNLSCTTEQAWQLKQNDVSTRNFLVVCRTPQMATRPPCLRTLHSLAFACIRFGYLSRPSSSCRLPALHVQNSSKLLNFSQIRADEVYEDATCLPFLVVVGGRRSSCWSTAVDTLFTECSLSSIQIWIASILVALSCFTILPFTRFPLSHTFESDL